MRVRRILLLTSGWVFAFLTLSLSQTQDQVKDFLEKSNGQKAQTVQPTAVSLALEETVNPVEYLVGPSDVINVSIWTSPPLSNNVTVTPEGTLIIPTVGEVPVSGLTLKAARDKILGEIRKKYNVGTPSVTLVTPREVVVAVAGSVGKPGKYTVRASDRVDKLIELANPPKETDPRAIRYASKRNILVQRRTGERLRVDITKYDATQDGRWNTLMCEGDRVFVPETDPEKDRFAVYGGVLAPGRFEMTPDDRLKDALILVRGFTARAMVDSIEYYRMDPLTTRLSKSIFSYKDLLAGAVENSPIQAGDRLVVKERPDTREDFFISIQGEVVYPGTYPISRESTHLRTAIERANGFTNHASLKSAYIARRSVQPDEVQLEKLLSLRGSVSPEDSAYYLLESDLRIRHEIVNTNFEALFLRNDTTQDIILHPYDQIVVPSFNRTIYVFGQVVSPGNVPFVQELSVEDYIQKAGGFTDKARTENIMIVKRATRQWLDPKETKLEDGDYIWVPRKQEHPFNWYLTYTAQLASVITAFVSIALLAVQLSR